MRMLAWLLGGIVAIAGAVVACIYGYELTGWALVRGGGLRQSITHTICVANAVVALVGALPGLLVGLLAGRLLPRP